MKDSAATDPETRTSAGSPAGVGSLTPSESPKTGVKRRTIIAGAAWSVPAVAMMASSPAYAVSGSSLTLSTTNMQVPASGASTVTATATNQSGAPAAGVAVSFTGPSSATFTPTSAVTNAAGVATVQVNLGTPWGTPGSTVTITGVTSSATTSQAFTVLGANAYGTGRGAYGEQGNGQTTNISTPIQLPLIFASPIVQIVTGSRFSLALLQDGTVWSTGSNGSGQLGDGTTTSRLSWAKIPNLAGVSQIAAGQSSAYALVSGQVMAWGDGSSGQLGNGSTASSATPVAVAGLSGAGQIAAGGSNGYALVGGAVKAWGNNINGELGNGTNAASSTPVSVSSLSGVTQIAAGNAFGLALAGGEVKAWGQGGAGQLGDATQVSKSTPVSVSGLSGVTQIAAGSISGYALLNGTVRGWGGNSNNEIGGAGGSAYRTTPVNVSSSMTGVTEIAAGSSSGYALVSGVPKAWGRNNLGQLGDGTTTQRVLPATVVGVSSVTSLARNGSQSPAMFFIR